VSLGDCVCHSSCSAMTAARVATCKSCEVSSAANKSAAQDGQVFERGQNKT
jgi:hypothetical protein